MILTYGSTIVIRLSVPSCQDSGWKLRTVTLRSLTNVKRAELRVTRTETELPPLAMVSTGGGGGLAAHQQVPSGWTVGVHVGQQMQMGVAGRVAANANGVGVAMAAVPMAKGTDPLWALWSPKNARASIFRGLKVCMGLFV